MRRAIAGVLFAVLMLGSLIARSLLTTGTPNANVTDQSGAAIPASKVVAKNTETGVSRETVTNQRGRYEIPNLPVGSYEITASALGFHTSVRSGLTLSIGQNAVVNHTLQVGEVSQSVTVSGEAPLEIGRAHV